MVDNLTDALNSRDFTCSGMHNDMDQREHDLIVREFRSGSKPLIIMTDLWPGIEVSHSGDEDFGRCGLVIQAGAHLARWRVRHAVDSRHGTCAALPDSIQRGSAFRIRVQALRT